jgi:hypothetical protein
MSPSPTLLPCPAGQPPLKLTGAATSAGFRCRERYQPIRGCPRRIRSTVWFRARCCLLATSLGRAARSASLLRQPGALRLSWRIVLRSDGPKVPQNQDCCGVAVPRGEEDERHRFARSRAVHFTETTARPLAPHPRHRPRPYRKEIAYLSNPHTLTFRRIWVVPSSKAILMSNRQPAASSILVHTELTGAKKSVPRRSMSQSWAPT